MKATRFFLPIFISVLLVAAAQFCLGEEEKETQNIDQTLKEIDQALREKEEQKLREDIDSLIDKIENLEDVREKAVAAQEIIDKGEKAVPYLVEVYPARSTALKGWLAQIFLKMNAAEKAKDALLDDFQASGLGAAPDVVTTLGKMKDERATPLILELLAAADDEQKRYLCKSLNEMTDYRGLDELSKGITSDDRVIWLNCCKGLGNLQGRALKELEEKRKALEGTEETQ